jgi:hypothetical protein
MKAFRIFCFATKNTRESREVSLDGEGEQEGKIYQDGIERESD